jgi:hypothetical protein
MPRYEHALRATQAHLCTPAHRGDVRNGGVLHRVHDYRHLIARWRSVARAAGLRLRPLASEGGFELFYIQTPPLAGKAGLYLSAGIHGDEPAAPEALFCWAKKNAARLAAMPLLIFPCLNPWGLRMNVRTDSRGRDLNRLFHHGRHPVVAAVRKVTRPHRFQIALAMHEDYDAQGVYLYEVQRGRRGFGEALLDCSVRILPVDPRRKIDISIANNGLIRRRISAKRFEAMGHPEAIWLHLFHSENTFTFETPSEAALELRVRAHMAVLDECARRISRAAQSSSG